MFQKCYLYALRKKETVKMFATAEIEVLASLLWVCVCVCVPTLFSVTSNLSENKYQLSECIISYLTFLIFKIVSIKFGTGKI